MNSTWLKIKVWTKVVTFSTIFLFVVIILSRNWNTRVTIDLLFVEYRELRLLLVLLLTAIFSVFGWWLFRTVFKTLRQIRDVQRNAHLERVEREHAEMKAKAAMLQTRPAKSADAP